MLPLFSARTRRISKISSCFRMPVAPAMSSSLAILVSAEMLISFIADSEIAWAGAAARLTWPGLARRCRWRGVRRLAAGCGGGGYAPPFDLAV